MCKPPSSIFSHFMYTLDILKYFSFSLQSIYEPNPTCSDLIAVIAVKSITNIHSIQFSVKIYGIVCVCVCGGGGLMFFWSWMVPFWHFQESHDLSEPEVPGVPWHPQILANQLTLSRPVGKIMPTKLLQPPREFRLSYGPAFRSHMSQGRPTADVIAVVAFLLPVSPFRTGGA